MRQTIFSCLIQKVKSARKEMLSLMSRGFGVAAFFLCAFICQPGFAAENWSDFVAQYVAQIRKTIDTTDMEGYPTVSASPMLRLS